MFKRNFLLLNLLHITCVLFGQKAQQALYPIVESDKYYSLIDNTGKVIKGPFEARRVVQYTNTRYIDN